LAVRATLSSEDCGAFADRSWYPTASSKSRSQTLAWTRITDPDEAASLLPAWFGTRMIGLRGRFGLLLTTGDVLRITSIGALHQSTGGGPILLDVLLDDGGIPDGIDTAWRAKVFLGAPLPTASVGTVNLAHVLAAVEFPAEQLAEQSGDAASLTAAENRPAPVGSRSEGMERATEASGSACQRVENAPEDDLQSKGDPSQCRATLI
jgi:hypothetical protein